MRTAAAIAMNPAALKKSLVDLKPNGTIIVNTDAFTKQNLSKAGYKATGPLATFAVVVLLALAALTLLPQLLVILKPLGPEDSGKDD